MAEVTWTEPAILDLKQIAEYIALDKVNPAKKLVKKVFASVNRLEDSPLSGRKPPELKNTVYREIIVGPCRIFYRVQDNQNKVYIIHVMRSEMQLRKYLLDDRLQENS